MKPTVLIIDDLPSVRLYHTSFLERKGYRCLEAGDGETALALLQGGASVDLVMLDLLMPEMHGATLLAQLRASPRCAALPVLIVTSEQFHAAECGLTSDPLVSVLTKPVLPTILLTNVQRLLARPEAAPSPA